MEFISINWLSHVAECVLRSSCCHQMLAKAPSLYAMQVLAVHRLEHLTSKAACLAAVQSSQHDISVEVVVFTANMRHVSQRQVSMLRQMIDDVGSVEPDVSKKWILLLHFMPGAALADSYPALFLYGWNFWYLDSCTGGVSQHEMLPVPLWTRTAAAVLHGHVVSTEQLLGNSTDLTYACLADVVAVALVFSDVE